MLFYAVILNKHTVRKWHINSLLKVIRQFQSYPAVCYIAGEEKEIKYNYILDFYFKIFTRNKKISYKTLYSIFEKTPTKIINFLLPANQIHISQLEIDANAGPFDFIIDFTSCPLVGNPESVSKQGIWKFSFTDNNTITNFPVAFDEILNEKKIVNGLIVAMKNENDYLLLREFCIGSVIFSYRKTLNMMLLQAEDMLIQTIYDIINKIHSTQVVEINYAGRKNPGYFMITALILKQVKGFFNFLWFRGCFVDNWNIGYVNKPVGTFLDKNETFKVNWIENTKKNKFIADPFGVSKDETIQLFYEELDYNKGVGYINTARLEGNRLVNENLILKKPYHLSYPYIFSDNGSVYCVPETNEANEVSLYKFNDFPSNCIKVKTLIPNFRGIDSTVFFYNGLWWLFTTNKSNMPQSILYAFYAPSLYDTWKPHENNPIKVDIRSSRGAGQAILPKR